MNIPGIDECALDAELGSRSLIEFVKMAWPIVEPGRVFLNNWHIGAVADHLEAVSRGDITRLVINIPPGSMKSLLISVMFPAWIWAYRPQEKFIYTSYAADVSRRDALKHRDIVESDWFKNRWTVTPKADAWTAGLFANKEGGSRLSTSVRGVVTGFHADVQVVDDPLKPLEVTGSLAVSKKALEDIVTWWDQTMSQRLQDALRSSRIIIMQRLHMGDLAGSVLKSGGYELLCLPMEGEGENRCHTSLGFEDNRAEGELLWPARFPAEAVATQKKELGSRGAAAQLQQRPSPAAGSIFKRAWVQHWKVVPPKASYIQSWDLSFKDADTSSYVVGQVWAVKGKNFYLVDQIRERLAFSDTCKAIINMRRKWPKAHTILIEDKANGPAVIEVLKKKITGIVAVKPEGGKEARANAVEASWEAEDVWIPHPDTHPWVDDFVEELVTFPAAAHDDQVDAMTQALSRLIRRSMEKYKLAVERMSQ